MIHPDILGTDTLIFDMDGTLTQSGKIAVTAIRKGFENFCKSINVSMPEMSDERLTEEIGLPSHEFYRNLLDEPYKEQWEKFRSFVFIEEDKFLATNRITYPGTIKTLELLKKRGYKMALVSNCSAPYLNSVVDSQKIRKYFDMVLCIDDRPNATKTSLIAECKATLGSSAAVIGDRKYDVEAALANDLPAVGALYGYGCREELLGTCTWVEDIRDLKFIFFPLREMAERLAWIINQKRPLDRPFVVGLSSLHHSVTNPFARVLLFELSERNISASHLPMEKCRLNNSKDWINDSYDWDKLQNEVLEPRLNGKIDSSWTLSTDDSVKPVRGRAGSVVLVEGSYIFNNSDIQDNFDLNIWIDIKNSSIPNSIRRNRRDEIERWVRTGNQKSEIDESALSEMENELDLWKTKLKDLYSDTKISDINEVSDIVIDGNRLDAGIILKK
jgi:phosphoglycolate phosphatase